MFERNTRPLKLLSALAVSGILHVLMLAMPVVPPSSHRFASPSAVPRLAARLLPPVDERSLSTPLDEKTELADSSGETPAPQAEPNRPGPHGLVESPLSAPYFDAADVDVRATPIDPPPLILPDAVVRQHIHGKVVMKVFIGATGTVDDVELVSSSHPGLLEEAARKVVQATRFSPAYRGGIAVKSSKRIEVVFDPHEPEN